MGDSRCRSFIGARTHSTIAALSTGVPTIAIAYSQKARGIFRDLFGNEEYLVPIGELRTETLLRAWDKLRANEHIVRRSLEENRPEMSAGAQRNPTALAEVLRGGRGARTVRKP